MSTDYASNATMFPSIRLTSDDDAQPLVRFIDAADLIRELSSIKGAQFVTIQSRTEPRMLAKHPETGEPNPYRQSIVKISRVNGVIGWQYERCVNRQRDREEKIADFEALPRKWGQRLPDSPFVEHNGTMYLELKVERSLRYHYEALDGCVIDATEIEPYLPSPSKSRQGVNREIVLRDYALTSIHQIKCGGVTYILRRDDDNENHEMETRPEMAGAA